MSQYKFTHQAQQDLKDIRRFTIEHWGSRQALSYFEQLKKTLELLSDLPLMGKKCPDLGSKVYRYVNGSHVIYYFNEPDSITIFAVLHQSMLPSHHLDKRC